MKFYQIDSFTDTLFSGNPAAVCILKDKWPGETIMQNIAAENNLSETAFVLDVDGRLEIRWFTPTTEVPLCGHATLAAAHVLFEHEGYQGGLTFHSANYALKVAYEGELLTLDFPVAKIWKVDFKEQLNCFNAIPNEVWRSEDEYLLIFDSRHDVENAVCNLEKAARIDLLGIIITAQADEDNIDFVSRYFGPKIGIDEDPVTGSAYTLLVPYWSRVMGKENFNAVQLSKRRGKLFCRLADNRVKIGGKAVTYAVGEIFI